MKNAKLFYAIPAIFLIVVLLAGCTQYSRTPNAPTATANDNIAPAPPQDNSDTTGFSQARARLVAYYTFDETSGDTAVDSSGNGNDAHGYSRTGVTHATGIKGGTVQFDGSNEAYLNVPDSETLAINGGFTVMAWVYVKTNTPAFQIIAKGYAFKLLTDSYKYRFNGGGDLLSQTSYTQYQWEHVAIVYDPAQPIAKKKIYVNGVLQGTQNGNIDESGDDYIFGRDGFIGKLDELKIYNRPLSAAEIKAEYTLGMTPPAPMTPTTGLVGYYKFDETSGPTAYDSSGLGNDANGYLRTGVTHSTGKFGGAVHFDGSNEAYLNVPYNRFLSTGGYFTIMAWVYVKTNTPAFQIIAKGYYGLGLLTDSYKYRFSGGGNLLSQTSYTQYQWEHVAIVYDPAQPIAKKKIYVNGVLQGTQNGNIDESGDDYIFGGQVLTGKLDELKIYNRPLSNSEILAEYQLGSKMAK